MKKQLAAAALVLMLSGCAASPAVDPTNSDVETPTTDLSPEEAFLSEFRDANPDADRATDEQWLAVGDSVCEAFESGASANEIVDTMQDSSLDPTEAASIVVSAAFHLCPEFAPE